MKVAIRIGGSLLTKRLDAGNFKKYVDVLKKLRKDGHKILVVTGGGLTSRTYLNIAKSLGADNNSADYVGIAVANMTGLTLAASLGSYAYPKVFIDPAEIKRMFGRKILVCGAWEPGHSTDYDLVYYARIVGADLVIKASNVDGVYSNDPRKFKNAKKYSRLTYGQFLKIISKNAQTPGKYRLFDLKAAKTIKKLKMKTVIVNGNDPKEILAAVKGKHHGTVIS